ncbi:hypothetical protein [Desertibacillus haloalkaliphilus]|uniref:hypothetical protein n=1 Tax=Desertibacillus haloalkaliphilus TaxID=1328930 RepID=UPI001C274C8D|nr:hypothetical protein [Desertibacillus haloalkaliphilus]MBU8906174.1 hypothetical protein [Desertibacillus haloalkaliphilus]
MDKRQVDEKKNEHQNQDLYGIDREMSLQSVNFATTKNSYLNEYMNESPDNESDTNNDER